MKKKDFLLEVKKELDYIKLHATDEEKSKLDFSTFDHSFGTNCIYGQMTGKCDSRRARELYTKTFNRIGGQNFSINPRLKFNEMLMVGGDGYTALEKYLFLVATPNDNKSKKHKEIIDYIKGNLEEIKI